MSKIEFTVYDRDRIKDFLNSYKTNPRNYFYGYEGNNAAVETGLDILFSAYTETEVIDNMKVCTRKSTARIALVAPMSAGKTEYYRRFSKMLGTPSIEIDGTKLTRSEEILETCYNTWKNHPLVREFGFKGWEKVESKTGVERYKVPPMSILIDEIHRVKKSVQDGLLKMCESKDGILVVDGVEYDFREVCIFIATNNSGKLGAAFKSRFTVVPLERPDLAALSKIVQSNNKDWSAESCFCIAKLCPVARQALAFANLVRSAMDRSGSNVSETIELVRKRAGLYKVGLSRRAALVLKSLADMPKGLSRNTLLASMDNMEEDEFDDEILPQLIPGHRPPLILIENRHKITKEGEKALADCDSEEM